MKKRDCVHVATTLTMLWSCQKNKSIYILTLLSLSIYLVVAAMFTTPWSWHKIKLIFIPIIFSLHIFLLKKCRIFALMTVSVAKSFAFRNFSGVLAFFLRKFSVFKRFIRETVISPSGFSVEPYMLYYPEFQWSLTWFISLKYGHRFEI